MGAVRILLVRITVTGQDLGFYVEPAPRNDLNFRCRGGRIEGPEGGRKKIAEGVVERLDDEGGAVFLIALEVETGELSCAEEESIVEKGLLEPEGVEARSMSTDETDRIGDDAHVGANIDAILPEAGGVEGETVSASEFAEVDVDRAADTAQPVLSWVRPPPGLERRSAT
jgi:hypothetical protein